MAGFPSGGRIAFEIAQQLRAQDQPVGLLALLDASAPGYRRMRSFPVRVILHIAHALRLGPVGAASYLRQRVIRLGRYFRPAKPRLFDDLDVPMNDETRALERSADAVHQAWLAYTVRPYDGDLVQIRATIGAVEPEMIDAPHSRELAQLLGRLLAMAPGTG